MTDLRTRIAAVAQNHVRCDECTFAKTPAERYLHFADAVIAELHLETTERYPTSCGTEVCLKGHYTKWVGNE